MKTSYNDKLSLLLFSIILLTIGYMLYGAKTGEFERHKSWVFSVAANDRNTILSASNNELFFWKNRHCTDRLAGHTDAIKSVSFSHNGLLFASGSIDKTVKIWSSTTRSVIKTLTKHTAGVNKVEFDASDKYLVSAGYDDKLFIWDVKSGTAIKELDIKNTDFSINKSDALAYMGTTCTLSVKIWNWQNGHLEASLGDGVYEADIALFLSVVMLLTLMSAFYAIGNSKPNRFSSVAIISILSAWSCGIFLICYFLKSYLKKAASVITWVFTSFTCLFFVSVDGAWLSSFTIPLALTFGYIQLVTAKATPGTSIAILANLFFIGLLCSRLVPV